MFVVYKILIRFSFRKSSFYFYLGDYYTLDGLDADGWPHWTLQKELPSFDLISQENLLKHYVIEYFRTEVGVHI